MPAVTVENPLSLPRIPDPDATTEVRPVRQLTTAPSGYEGEGFPVRRAFAGVSQAELDPFVHMDQMGEVEYGPGEPKGTPWHPHRGFETVTYMIDGTFQHQDSIGGGGLITNGGTQWMTAGAGILHIERPPDELVASGGLFHGIQLWVNLPAQRQAGRPALPGHPADGGHPVVLERRRRPGPGDRRLGRRPRRTGRHPHPDRPRPRHPRAQGPAWCSPGPATTTPSSTRWRAGARSAASSGPIQMGQLAVLGVGDAVEVGGGPGPGEPVGRASTAHPRRAAHREPVAHYGPFVMNTEAELQQAFEDFRAGRLGTVPADHIGD